VRTSITVVDSVAAGTPASVSVVDNRQIAAIPGVNLDDRLRSVPGFSLFRRTSSMVAHPTTQGVSLRGIGSSGASRTLVLWDGIPVNDPFGGWVYWTRLAPDELERIEISRGASTSIFGDRAMGGAIALFSREASARRLVARYEGGNRNTHDASLGYSHLFGSRWAASGQARAYTTDGYYIVPADRRGRVDTLAGVRFASFGGRGDYLGASNRVFLKADILAEDRKNGTVIQNNSTGMGTIAGRYFGEHGKQTWSVLGFHTREEFHSAFSAIAASRNTETLSYRQSVPAEAVGTAGLWSLGRSRWNLLAGGDAFRVEGTSIDMLVPTGQRIGGGTQLQRGVFVQTDATLGPARFFLGGRQHLTSQPSSSSSFFSPSAGAVVGHGRLRARGSVYRSFRAPTLNELYREFRAGNAITQPNAALRPETLFGAEAGLDFVGETTRIRATFYRNDLSDLITNVTLSSTANQIVRQRRNAVSALSRGAELDAVQRWRNWRGEASYLFVDSRFETRERVPQIARHQGSAQLGYDRGNTFVTAGLRSFAAQFEDDRNQFLLPGFATLQIAARQRLTGRLSAIAAFENLLNRQYMTGFSPTPTIGAPRLWRLGLRWDGRL
jgi:outer membrane cobalamin receptor